MLSSQAELTLKTSDSSDNLLSTNKNIPDQQTVDEKSLTEFLRSKTVLPAALTSLNLSLTLYQNLDALKEKLSKAPILTNGAEKFAEMISFLQQRKTFLHGPNLLTDDLDKAQVESASRTKIFSLFNAQLTHLFDDNPTLFQLAEFETEAGLYMQLDATYAHLSKIIENYNEEENCDFIKTLCSALSNATIKISNEFLAYLEMRSPTEKIITLLGFENTLAHAKTTIDLYDAMITSRAKQGRTPSPEIERQLKYLADIKDTFNCLFTIVRARCICIETQQAFQAESDCASQVISIQNNENKPSCKEEPFRNLSDLFLPHYQPSVRNLGFFERYESTTPPIVEGSPNKQASYEIQPESFKNFIKQFGCNNTSEWQRLDLKVKEFFVTAYQKFQGGPDNQPRTRATI
jgi:hypothetical protein